MKPDTYIYNKATVTSIDAQHSGWGAKRTMHAVRVRAEIRQPRPDDESEVYTYQIQFDLPLDAVGPLGIAVGSLVSVTVTAAQPDPDPDEMDRPVEEEAA